MTTPPKRIQRKRTRGWKMPEGAVTVDRSTPFGSPFPISKGTARTLGVDRDIWQIGTWEGPGLWFKDTKREAVELSVKCYQVWVNADQNEALRDKAKIALRGCDLACWCALCDQHRDGKSFGVQCPDCAPCHSDPLGQIANAPDPTPHTPSTRETDGG